VSHALLALLFITFSFILTVQGQPFSTLSISHKINDYLAFLQDSIFFFRAPFVSSVFRFLPGTAPS
jgi:hypothetical protein